MAKCNIEGALVFDTYPKGKANKKYAICHQCVACGRWWTQDEIDSDEHLEFDCPAVDMSVEHWTSRVMAHVEAGNWVLLSGSPSMSAFTITRLY